MATGSLVELIYVKVFPEQPVPDLLRRAVEHLADRGFAGLPQEQGVGRRLQRGSKLRGLLTLAMDRLHTTLFLVAVPEGNDVRLTLRYQVSTWGQLITQVNRSFWDVEVESLTDQLMGNDEEARQRWLDYEEVAREDRKYFVVRSFLFSLLTSALLVFVVWGLKWI